jgi:hypothetical protein
MLDFNYENILKKLDRSWSIESSSLWTRENHAKGQCGVTAYLIYELYGGKILKTPIMNEMHFYNGMYGEIYDFTKSQFTIEIQYFDLPSTPEEVFKYSTFEQYENLKKRFLNT